MLDKPLILLAGIGAIIVGIPVLVLPWIGYLAMIASLPLELFGNLGNILPFLNVTLAKLFAIATLGAIVLHILMRRHNIVWSRELTIWCIYMVMGVVSLIGASEIKRGIQELVVVFSTLVFLFLTINLCTTMRRIRMTIGVVVAISVATFAFAVIQRFLPSMAISERVGWDLANDVSFGYEVSKLDAGSSGSVLRSAGLSSHPNVMSATTGLMVPILVWIALTVNSIRIKWLASFGALICVAAAAVSLSRSGAMVYIAVIPLLLIFRLIRLTAFQTTIAIVLFLVSIPFWPESFFDRVLNPTSWTSAGSETVKWRMKLWSSAIYAIADNPLNGVGIGNNRTIFDYFYYPWNSGLQTVHNTYLQITMETGIQGLLCWLAMFVSVAMRCTELIRSTIASVEMRLLGSCILVSLIGFAFCGLGIDLNRIGFKTMWLMMAIAICASLLLRKKSITQTDRLAT